MSVSSHIVFVFFLHVLSLFSFVSATETPQNPRANPLSVVQIGKNVRLTVLTNEILRMEYDPQGNFRDDATLVFQNRFFKTATLFQVLYKNQWTIIRTEKLEFAYRNISGDGFFSDKNLQVRLLDPLFQQEGIWKPSLTDSSRQDTMPGTLRTLDAVNGQASLDCMAQGPSYTRDNHCTRGLFSRRRGYVIVDDSITAAFDHDPVWPWVKKSSSSSTTPPSESSCSSIPRQERRVCGMETVTESNCRALGCCFDSQQTEGFKCFYSHESYQDLYFFGHGLNFKRAMKEFTELAGKIPIPPRYAFGVFYSRWWAYSDADLHQQIVDQYETHGLPLDVLVMDMDWHLTFYKDTSQDQAGQPKGWTGFTWNKNLFPNPKAFLHWLHTKGIAATLNLHPASGVQPWEESYVQVAKAMGIDPSSQNYIPFEITNKKFVETWLDLSIGPREREGIDFWWLDWQQGEDWIERNEGGSSTQISMTLWLNHVFFTNPIHWRKKNLRPMILHRFGGLGNHRYQVGFSGDVVVSWESLRFQPYFTTMAANVGFGYWSHDLGGFQNPSEPELFTRWLQWGIFSPIFRTHSSKDALSDRRIWKYADEYYEITRQAMELRASLVPYLYTQAKRAHEEGLSILRGLFFDHPESNEAYDYTEQYLFGESFLVSPILAPMDQATRIATKSTWFPPGTSWYDFSMGSLMKGPVIYTAKYTMEEIPYFGRVGSIIPFNVPMNQKSSLGKARDNPSSLKLLVVPGAKQAYGWLYEDDGITTKYQEKGGGAVTRFEYATDCPVTNVCSEGIASFVIYPVEGKYDGMVDKRQYVLEVPASIPATRVLVNGQEIPFVVYDEISGDGDNNGNSWSFNGESLSLLVYINQPMSVHQKVNVQILSMKTLGGLNVDPSHLILGGTGNTGGGIIGRFARLHAVKRLLDDQWGVDTVYMSDYPNLLTASEMDQRISYDPTQFFQELEKFETLYKAAVKEIQQIQGLKDNIRAQVLAYLSTEISIKNPCHHCNNRIVLK